jgi:flagellum-specific ATP synthase
VFALLPKLLERSGTSSKGSITGLYTVLVDGDDMNEPVADAVRAILDGHVVLTRELAHAGHYPAIDVLQSVSRLATEILPPEVQDAGRELRRLMAARHDKEDLIAIGAYQQGSDPLVDAALARWPAIEDYLRQPHDESASLDEADDGVSALCDGVDLNAFAEPVPAEAEVPPVVDTQAPGPTAIPPLHLSV